MDKSVHLLSASTLTGDSVTNPQGESLGDLKEIMIDIASGRIAYGVLSFGGVLGMGDKLFAVPWSALTVDQENKQLVLNASQDSLKNAPGFDKDNWPSLADPAYAGQVRDYYASGMTDDGLDQRRAMPRGRM